MRSRIALVTVLAACATLIGPVSSPALVADKQDGLAFVGWWNDIYDGQDPETAMANAADTGADWVSILATWYQEKYTSTRISRYEGSPTDDGVAHMIRTAHDLGLSVMLKAHIDLWDDPDHWRGEIGTTWGAHSHKWDKWFRNYRAFIFHYAELAQAEGVEQFAVGTELVNTVGHVREWRRIIAGVRARFSGTLTYAATVGGEEHAIQWWDDLDLIGVDAYYGLTNELDPTLQELEDGWAPYLQELADLSQQWGDKPIIFTEIGYRSIDGANMAPWDWYLHGTIDLQEQADCFRAMQIVWDEDWFAGMFLWDWPAVPGEGGPNNLDYTPYGKPALDVLTDFYSTV